MSLSRRNFLRTQGAILTLPFLHSLSGAAGQEPDKTKPSKKLLIMYIPNGIVRRCFFPGEEDATSPAFVGGFNADKTKNQLRTQNKPGIYPLDLTSSMLPLKDHTEDITLVTGLDRTFKNGQDVHAQGASCYLTSLSPVQAQEQGIRHPNGRSLDQVIGDAVGQSSIFNTLEVSCNGFRAPKEPIEFDNISWYGPGKIAPSIREPQKLYDRLFLRDSYREHLANVTDLVLADTRSLAKKLAPDDRRTLGEFMEMIRSIEIRMQKMEKLLSDVDLDIPKTEVLPRVLSVCRAATIRSYITLISSRPFKPGSGSSMGALALEISSHASSLLSRVSISRIPWKYSPSLSLSVLVKPRCTRFASVKSASNTLRFSAMAAWRCSRGRSSAENSLWKTCTGSLGPATGLPRPSQASDSPGP